jgi:putative membrane protein
VIVLKRPHGLRLLFVLRGSILGRIAPALLACGVLATAVTVSRGVLFHWKVTLTTVPFLLIGLALAIFLGFRNSAAYERYWEGRRLWGELVHRARTARPPGAEPDAARRAGDRDRPRRSAHPPDPSRHRLRPRAARAAARDRGRCCGEALAAAGRRRGVRRGAARHRVRPRPDGGDLGGCIRSGVLDPRLGAEIDQTLTAMSAVAAGCERIRSTPIPFVYTLLLHRTATLYCFLLPFGLVDTIGVMTPLVVVLIAYTFFGLDAVGDEIEDPFGIAPHHLPLDALCRTIEIDLLAALGETELPPPFAAVNDQLT